MSWLHIILESFRFFIILINLRLIWLFRLLLWILLQFVHYSGCSICQLTTREIRISVCIVSWLRYSRWAHAAHLRIWIFRRCKWEVNGIDWMNTLLWIKSTIFLLNIFFSRCKIFFTHLVFHSFMFIISLSLTISWFEIGNLVAFSFDTITTLRGILHLIGGTFTLFSIKFYFFEVEYTLRWIWTKHIFLIVIFQLIIICNLLNSIKCLNWTISFSLLTRLNFGINYCNIL